MQDISELDPVETKRRVLHTDRVQHELDTAMVDKTRECLSVVLGKTDEQLTEYLELANISPMDVPAMQNEWKRLRALIKTKYDAEKHRLYPVQLMVSIHHAYLSRILIKLQSSSPDVTSVTFDRYIVALTSNAVQTAKALGQTSMAVLSTIQPIQRSDFAAMLKADKKHVRMASTGCFHTVKAPSVHIGRSMAVRDHMIDCCQMELRAYKRSAQEDKKEQDAKETKEAKDWSFMVGLTTHALDGRDLPLACMLMRYQTQVDQGRDKDGLLANDFDIVMGAPPPQDKSKHHALSRWCVYRTTDTSTEEIRPWRVLEYHIQKKLGASCRIDYFAKISQVFKRHLAPSLADYAMTFLVQDPTPYQRRESTDALPEEDQVVQKFSRKRKRDEANDEQPNRGPVKRTCMTVELVPTPKTAT